MDKNLMKATFAGGCFWCMQPPFRALDGVTEVTSGYAGGTKVKPSYEEVSTGMTGHAESVQITYDTARISFDQLLDVFWRQIDPVDPDGQFADKGSQYRTAIFYHDGIRNRLPKPRNRSSTPQGNSNGPLLLRFGHSLTSIRPKNITRILIRKIPGGIIRTSLFPVGNPSLNRYGEHRASG
jgi:methionine-S-sulfoxide reductase